MNGNTINMTHTQQQPKFSDLGISQDLLDILTKQDFVIPTPIQTKAIPPALDGQDIVGIAQTGTGKTLAFGIPIIERLFLYQKGQALIIVPTRELALQVDEALRRIGRAYGMRTAVLIGGASMHHQLQDIRNKPHVIVATPGRLVDHMQQKLISLKGISILVLDEADRMLDIGFAPQIKQIIGATPRERQTMLFSATMPTAITSLALQYMKTPLRIETAPSGTAVATIDQELFVVHKDNKLQLLEKILVENEGSVLVFARTKHGTRRLTSALRHMGQKAIEIHSGRSLAQRKAALSGFKNGQYRVLVATDIAARGIDVVGISLVVNYDLPEQAEDYVHRIGRTGRAGMGGKAISFAAPDQRRAVMQIERLIRKTLQMSSLPKLPDRRDFPPDAPEKRNFSPRSQHSNNRRAHTSGIGHRSAPRNSFRRNSR